jgi:hypothetical protein
LVVEKFCAGYVIIAIKLIAAAFARIRFINDAKSCVGLTTLLVPEAASMARTSEVVTPRGVGIESLVSTRGHPGSVAGFLLRQGRLCSRSPSAGSAKADQTF